LLGTSPDIICAIAGELVAEGLIQVVLPQQTPNPDMPPVAINGFGNGYVAPGYAAAPAAPWNASVPVLPGSDIAPQSQYLSGPSGLPFETESQWGNGGNGATFIPGRGWITTPQPLQPLQSNEQPSQAQSAVYAYANNGGY
jgi:hypothetical protein